MLEVEKSRAEIIPTWMGQNVAGLIAKSAAFFESIGGYPLPLMNRKTED